MRVLFAVIPAPAHLLPVVPFAWALQCAGHEVRIASHPCLAEAITATGLFAVPLGPEADLAASVHRALGDPALLRIMDTLALVPAEEELRAALHPYMLAPFADYYALPGPPGGPTMIEAMTGFARSWQPDLVLWDPLFFPAPVAARACGAAHARLLWGQDHFAWGRQRFTERAGVAHGPAGDLMAEVMRPALARAGQDFSEELLVGQWTVDPTPERIRLPVDLPYVPVRRTPYNGAGPVPGWLHRPPSRPRVCLTLGVSGRQFFADDALPVAEILAELGHLDIEVVATLDKGQSGALGRIPDNVRTVDYVPLSLLLPTCSAVIHHGGGGTFTAAAAARVPQLIIPKQGGDYADYGLYAAELGAGLFLPRDAGLSGASVAGGVRRLLEEPSFRLGADALCAEMAAVPGPDGLVALLVELTQKHRRRGRASPLTSPSPSPSPSPSTSTAR